MLDVLQHIEQKNRGHATPEIFVQIRKTGRSERRTTASS